MAARGEFRWPRAGNSRGHARGEVMAACGEILVTVDSRSGEHARSDARTGPGTAREQLTEEVDERALLDLARTRLTTCAESVDLGRQLGDAASDGHPVVALASRRVPPRQPGHRHPRTGASFRSRQVTALVTRSRGRPACRPPLGCRDARLLGLHPHPSARDEQRLVPVVPAHPEPLVPLVALDADHLPAPSRLTDLLRLDHDPVTYSCLHVRLLVLGPRSQDET